MLLWTGILDPCACADMTCCNPYTSFVCILVCLNPFRHHRGAGIHHWHHCGCQQEEVLAMLLSLHQSQNGCSFYTFVVGAEIIVSLCKLLDQLCLFLILGDVVGDAILLGFACSLFIAFAFGWTTCKEIIVSLCYYAGMQQTCTLLIWPVKLSVRFIFFSIFDFPAPPLFYKLTC